LSFERKTAEDLGRSIIDGRLFRQVSALRYRVDRPILLVEGLQPSSLRAGVPWHAVRGALREEPLDECWLGVDPREDVVAEVRVLGVPRPAACLVKRVDHGARRGDGLHLVFHPVEVPDRQVLEGGSE